MQWQKIGRADFVSPHRSRIHCLAAYAHPIFFHPHKPGRSYRGPHEVVFLSLILHFIDHIDTPRSGNGEVEGSPFSGTLDFGDIDAGEVGFSKLQGFGYRRSFEQMGFFPLRKTVFMKAGLRV